MEDFLFLDELFQDEERQIRDAVDRWVDEQVIPKMPACCEAGEFPDSFIGDLAALGVLGMCLPSEYGGAGASYTAYGLVCQALERGDSGVRSFASVQSSLCMFPIFKFGDESQRQNFLPKMAAGKLVGSFGLTEPDHGSNPAGMTTKAEKVDGGWCLNGAKQWITNAPIADIAIVWAKTADGIRGFIVEKTFDGFSRETIKQKMSLRVSHTGGLVFDDCFVPDSHYLPGSDCGLKAPLMCLTEARYGIAWGAIGAAIACFDEALAYTKARQQFDRPLAGFQLVQKDLTRMFTEIVKAQTLNFRLGQLKDQDRLTPMQVCMAKMNACREALSIARSARNLLGANGISLEYSVIRHMTNLESVFTYEGTDNIHHLAVGKHITGINAFC